MTYLHLLFCALAFGVLTVEAVRDWHTGEVELRLAVPLAVCGAALSFAGGDFIAPAVAAGCFALFSALAACGLAGWGDGPLFALAVLTLPGLQGLFVPAYAFVIGGAVAAAGLALGRFRRRQALPFVPFLWAGWLAAAITCAVR